MLLLKMVQNCNSSWHVYRTAISFTYRNSELWYWSSLTYSRLL